MPIGASLSYKILAPRHVMQVFHSFAIRECDPTAAAQVVRMVPVTFLFLFPYILPFVKEFQWGFLCFGLRLKAFHHFSEKLYRMFLSA
ncbi:MAG: hypothetical protein MJZ52_02025 [Bacteroidales bacterium]|nr:hypothetical protein [Bacteroidales bacterium]